MQYMNFLCSNLSKYFTEHPFTEGRTAPLETLRLTAIRNVHYMDARCLPSDRHFLDALHMLFIIFRAVIHNSGNYTQRDRISNTFSCR